MLSIKLFFTLPRACLVFVCVARLISPTLATLAITSLEHGRGVVGIGHWQKGDINLSGSFIQLIHGIMWVFVV